MPPKRNKKCKKKSTGRVAFTNTGRRPIRVTFGSVSVREFNRCLGTDVVPEEGGWPLGLAREIFREYKDAETVDDYKADKQSRLKARWKELYKEDATEPPEWLETRQRTNKNKSKNPLFRMLSEKERNMLLTSGKQDDVLVPALGSTGKVVRNTRSRSGSSNETGRQTRAHSHSHSTSWLDQFNDNYPKDDVHGVRDELEQLRNSRSKEGSIGCTCRKLHVYLLPPGGGGGGKKANPSRRMDVLKVKEELKKRQLFPTETRTREEIELLLHGIVEKEPCCDIDCPCMSNGIECQSDACQCWYTSHQAKKGNNSADDLLSVVQIQSRCGNEQGMHTFDATKIDAFRGAFVCQVIKTEAESSGE